MLTSPASLWFWSSIAQFEKVSNSIWYWLRSGCTLHMIYVSMATCTNNKWCHEKQTKLYVSLPFPVTMVMATTLTAEGLCCGHLWRCGETYHWKCCQVSWFCVPIPSKFQLISVLVPEDKCVIKSHLYSGPFTLWEKQLLLSFTTGGKN